MRHRETPWRAAMHPPSVHSFKLLAGRMEPVSARGIILDSGCGTGQSTRLIAAAYPDLNVIGVDRSAHRLGRLAGSEWPEEPWVHREENAWWLRADLPTFWRLAYEAGWRLERHYLLYPNPWPKPGQLRRRWHGHPVFPTLLGLGGQLELRTNWAVYAAEFRDAVQCLTGLECDIQDPSLSEISTPFEKKYRARGHDLFLLQLNLDAPEVARIPE